MTGWNEYGHAIPTGLPVDRYLGSGDLQDAENCGYAPVSVLAELDVDRAQGDPQIQFRDGRIALVDGTVLERGGTLNCVWAVTRTPGPDHSGVAGEPEATTKEASEVDSPATPTPIPAPDPESPAAADLAGAGMVRVSWTEAVKAATEAGLDAEARRAALADRAIVETLTERDDAEEWADRLAHAISLAAGIDIGDHSNLNDPWERALAAAPLIAAQALRSAAAVLLDDDRLEPTGHDDRCGYGPPGECDCHRGAHYRWLIARADELERGADHG